MNGIEGNKQEMVKSRGPVTVPLDRARAVLWLRQRAG